MNPIPVHVEVVVEDEVARGTGVLLEILPRTLVALFVILPDVTFQEVGRLERLAAEFAAYPLDFFSVLVRDLGDHPYMMSA